MVTFNTGKLLKSVLSNIKFLYEKGFSHNILYLLPIVTNCVVTCSQIIIFKYPYLFIYYIDFFKRLENGSRIKTFE